MRALILLVALAGSIEAFKIVTKGKSLTVVEGSDVELSCYIQDMTEDDEVIWKKGNEPLYAAEVALTDDKRYVFDRDGSNFSMVITDIEPMDMADFACSVSEEAQVQFKVVVHTRPQVHIVPDNSIYSIKEGEKNVVIKCQSAGNPVPDVKWHRKDGKMPSDIQLKGHHFVIHTAKTSHSGDYQCIGTNSAGTDKRTITLRVHEYDPSIPETKPWVKTPTSFIPVRKGDDMNITCSYDGNPPPITEWFFNGYKINFADARFNRTAQFAQRKSNYSNSILTLVGINEDSFGDYMCRASNSLGSSQNVVHVSGRPGPPVLSLDEWELSWTVEAFEPVIEYQVHFRPQGGDEWEATKNIRKTKNDQQGEIKWAHSIDLRTFLKRGVAYELQVKARNGLGWGSFAKDYVMVTLPEEDKVTAGVSSFWLSIFVLPSLLLFSWF